MATRFAAEVNKNSFWPTQHQASWLDAPREAFSLWLSTLLALRGMAYFRESTLDTYEGIFLAWRAYLATEKIDLFKVQPAAVIDFFATAQLAPVSQRRYYQLLAKLYDYFHNQEWISINPFDSCAQPLGILIPLSHAAPEWLPPHEQHALIAVLNTLPGWRGQRDRALAALLLGAGLRVSEARNLQLLDIDSRTWRLKLTPGGVHRNHTTQVLANGPWQAWLQDWLNVRTGTLPGQWVVCATAKGTAISASAIFRRVDGWLAAAGLTHDGAQRGPNRLRNTFAKAALSCGLFSIDEVKDFLGHYELRATLRHLPE